MTAQPSAPKGPKNPAPSPSAADSAPVEVILKILPLLSPPDLIHCAQVSRHFHSVASSLIHPTSHKSISLDISLHSPARSENNRTFCPAAKTLDPRVPLQAHLCRLTDFHLSSNPFEHTTHLTLTSHNRTDCVNLPPLFVPNLVTLRIQPGYQQFKLDLCGATQDPHGRGNCCPLITYLRPRRLILGGTTSGFLGTGAGLWSTPFPPFVKELVLTAGMTTGRTLPGAPVQTSGSFLDHIPESIKKVTIDLTDGWDRLYVDHTGNGQRETVNEDLTEQWDSILLGRALMRVCARLSKDQAIEVVGAEVVDHCSLEFWENDRAGRFTGPEEYHDGEPWQDFMKRDLMRVLKVEG
ncbi:uncharacterized protein MKK02DRAFT_32070 [Dioszegia hungarica]|uniref:F-box domain-containing protein n=1 Tax=Dioszegia hungarica TaxID=4972 RepID=A0AA38HDF5_9TREE|nr:uncharacterized protein MKK02DRAFT_32070 [Dioszegia hungarica]KAI9638680.1 hypothetical protein MKK02DRAFT_32070 [Dioszegia hungarica]